MRALRGAVLVVAGVALLVAPAHATLSAEDKRTLAEMALQWAIDGGIADFKLVKDPSTIYILDANLPARAQLQISGRKVEVRSLVLMQALADAQGDFLYFRVGPFSEKDQHATVPIALVWSVSVNSTAQYLSGGGATLEFEKRDGKWQQLPVTNRWMS
jgi:hypothetical protein